jgi:uncharacterized membrane protein YfcA
MDATVSLIILIVVVAFFAQSIFGFGGGLISIPLLSLLVSVQEAVTLVLIFQVSMGILIVKTYKDTSWKVVVPVTAGLLVGTFIGTFFLAAVSDAFLRRFLAVSTLVFLVKMVFFPNLKFGKLRDTRQGLVSGVVGGFFQGMIGTGGPVFVMYLSAALPDMVAFRASLIYLLFVSNVVRLVISIPAGLLNAEIFRVAGVGAPLFLVAIFLGQRIHYMIKEAFYRYCVYAILFFSALSLFLKA